MNAKDSTIAFRVDAELKARLGAVAEYVGIRESTILIQAVQAVVVAVEKHGVLRLPIAIQTPRKGRRPGAFSAKK